MNSVVQCVLRGDDLVLLMKEIGINADSYVSISADGYCGVDYEQAILITAAISSIAMVVREYIKLRAGKKIELNINGNKVVIHGDDAEINNVAEIIQGLMKNEG